MPRTDQTQHRPRVHLRVGPGRQRPYRPAKAPTTARWPEAILLVPWGADIQTHACELQVSDTARLATVARPSPTAGVPGAVEARLPDAMPLCSAAPPACPWRRRQRSRDPCPAPPAHRPTPPDATTQGRAYRPGPARGAQPRPARTRWSCFFVKPETLLRWHRRMVAGAWNDPRRGPGRPPMDHDLQRLILRLATENLRWGYQRIKGELLRLGTQASTTAIRTLLRRHGLDPAPRRAATTWRAFLRQQAAGIVACDLLHRRHGLAVAAVCAVLHRTGHRRVHLAGVTPNPTPPGSPNKPATCYWCSGNEDAGCASSSAIVTRNSVAGSTRCSVRRAPRCC